MSRAAALVLVAGLTCGLAGCRTTTPVKPALDAREVPMLDAGRTREDLDAILGVSPRCLSAAPGTQVCEWRLSGRDRGYRTLARVLERSDSIGVICALPSDGSERAVGSCTIHQRRSNRNTFAPPSGKPGPRHDAALRRLEERIAEARAEIDGAGDFLSMVRVLGELPEGCDPLSGERLLCEWILSNRSYGHGAVAASIDAWLHQKVRVVASFGPDGRRLGDWRADGL